MQRRKLHGVHRRKHMLRLPNKNHPIHIFLFEATQESGNHIVNWVDCQDLEGNNSNFETVEEFCEFVFAEEEIPSEENGKKKRKKVIQKHKGYTFIAHNAKAYDLQFVLKYYVEHQIKPYCIFNGTKIMMMEIAQFKIRFIDSINFVQSALSLFPKTFGFIDLKKGFFRHYFNKTCNRHYISPIPSKKNFGPDQMSKQKRKEFLEWYEKNKDMTFNFQKELKEYCRSDVDILRRSMLKFREDFISMENIDPLQYIKIASVCNTIYRSNYMPAGSIYVV